MSERLVATMYLIVQNRRNRRPQCVTNRLKKNIKYLYNYSRGAWIKVTSHANLGCSRVWGGECGGGRARAGTPTLPGCDSATLEPTGRAPRAPLPRASLWHQRPLAHAHPTPPSLLPPMPWYLVQNLISYTYIDIGTLAELKYQTLIDYPGWRFAFYLNT